MDQIQGEVNETQESNQSVAETSATETNATETNTADATAQPESVAPVVKSRRATRKKPEVTPSDSVDAASGDVAAQNSSETPAEEAPKKTVRRTTRKKTAEPVTEQAVETPAEATVVEAVKAVDDSKAADESKTVEEGTKASARTTRRRAISKTAGEKAADKAETASDALKETTSEAAQSSEADASSESDKGASADEKPAAQKRQPRKRVTKASANDKSDEKAEDNKSDKADDQAKTNAESGLDAKSESKDSKDSDEPSEQKQQRGSRSRQNNRDRNNKDQNKDQKDQSQSSKEADDEKNADQQEQQSTNRSTRTRQRDRKRRTHQNDDLLDPELNDDDVLLPIAGILDVLDNYAFVRTSGYLAGPSDVYVSLSQIKKYSLRKGDAIVGAIRKPQDGESGGRQKYNAIVKIESVNGQPLSEDMKRVDFADLTPIYPQERLRLETAPEKVTQRVIDMIAPIGKGQRGLIVAPPKAGKTVVLQQIASAVAQNNPEAHLMVVLVDERPEEVTDMQRSINGEVVASTFDRPAEDHITVAELAIERAKRLVEMGHDVVLLLDSITRLGRAYNQAAPTSNRALPGVIDASTLHHPKKFFGAARNVENGGSLTILATALVETGSQADEAIFEEFQNTANMELRLSRELADRRIFPAVNLKASSTRREEMLLSQDEVRITWKLRRALGNMSEQEGADLVLPKIKETATNVEFLMLMQKTQGLV